MSSLPRGATVRRDAGIYGYERALRRHGVEVIAGVDEAGRGACAGPLVAGAAILPPGKAGIVPGLADSKLLTEKAREKAYDQIVRRAVSWSVVVVSHEECDRLGMHVANVEALRRAVARLSVPAEYVLTDGFPVDGLGVPGLADSKLLTAKARERCYEQVLRRAVAWSVVVMSHEECDRLGMHVVNVEALRRAVAKLDLAPSYVLTDGFPVDGLGVPGLAVWKGDRVAACIAAASVLAKVTRDRIMTDLDAEYPAYDFKTHKGYVTDVHNAALAEHGPCEVHRMRFVNVRRAAGLETDVAGLESAV